MGLEDTLYPINLFQWKNPVIIAFSESGETESLLEAVNQFKQKDCCVLSINWLKEYKGTVCYLFCNRFFFTI